MTINKAGFLDSFPIQEKRIKHFQWKRKKYILFGKDRGAVPLVCVYFHFFMR